MELDAAPMTFNFYLFWFCFVFLVWVFMCTSCTCACVFLSNLGSKVEPWGSRRAERILLIVFFFYPFYGTASGGHFPSQFLLCLIFEWWSKWDSRCWSIFMNRDNPLSQYISMAFLKHHKSGFILSHWCWCDTDKDLNFWGTINLK